MLPQALMVRLLCVLVHVGQDGKQLRKQSLSWNEPPSAVVYTEPYIIAQLPHSLQVGLCKPVGTTGLHSIAYVVRLVVPSMAMLRPNADE